MRVFRGFDNLPPFRHAVATIGSFDGVHRGHCELLRCVVNEARVRGGESIVMTFDPHPRITLGRAEGLRLLSTKGEKLRRLEEAGIDNVIFIPFTVEFSRLTHEEFLSELVVGKASVETLVVGYNHRFGRDRQGDSLSVAASGLDVVEVSRYEAEGDKVSSTVVRRAVAEGDMAAAWRLLGYPYTLSCRGCGDEELEIEESEYKLLPPCGEYNARTEEDREFHLRVAADGRVYADCRLSDGVNFIEILGKR